MTQKAIKTADELAETTGAYDSRIASQNIFHVTCHERVMLAQFKDERYPIIQDQLDILNRHMLAHHEEVGLDLDSLYSLLRMMQQITSTVSSVIARKKDKILIRETEIYRAKTHEQKQVEKQETRKEQEKKTRLQAERIDPALRIKRKAIDGLMSTLGLSREQAEKMINEANPPVETK
jgi:NACalpha-BTF3-like transcription factor